MIFNCSRFKTSFYKFDIQKLHIEWRMMDHQLGSIQKIQQFPRDLPECWLVSHLTIRDSVYFDYSLRDFPFRIDIELDCLASPDTVDQLYCSHFNNPMAFPRLKASGLGIQYNLTIGTYMHD